MTFLQMQTMLADLLQYDLDNYQGESPAATDVAEQLNYAARFISKEIYQFDPSIAMTLTTDDGDMDLFSAAFARDVVEVKLVVVNGITLRRADGNYGLWTQGEITRFATQFRTDSNGTPNKAWQVNRTLYLHPKPSGAFANNFVAGQYLCATLDGQTTSASYDLPEELHPAVVRLAADFAADPSVTEAEGLARLQRYAGKAGYDIKQERRRNKRLASDVMGSPQGSSATNFIW